MSGSVRVPRRVAAWLVLAGLLVGACGGGGDNDDDDGASPGTTGGTTTDDGAGTGGAEGTGGEDEEVEAQRFVSRPDLSPPVIDVTASEGPTPGYLFLAPKQAGAQKGPLILDDGGELVWAAPTEATVADFRVQSYRGRPVLTWWEGESLGGYGDGEFVVADTSYREVARFPAGDGRPGDLHEFQLTDEGTALIAAYVREPADLSAVDGPADGYVLETYIREVDVETGAALFEWRPGDHVPLTDTFSELVPDAAATEAELDDDGTAEAPFDWFHVNSVAEDGDDTLLISARNTHAVYALDRRTGELRWTLGGKSSDFEMAEGATFAWQHDARRLPDGTISLFDNQADPPVGDESRALVLALDEAGRRATVARELAHPDGLLAGSQGNAQVLGDGSVVVGWGSRGAVTEFDPGGEVAFHATWAPADSYRVYRMPWSATPTAPPDVVARPTGTGTGTGNDTDGTDAGDGEAAADTGADDGDAAEGDAGGAADGGVEVFVSWNGATEVESWRVLGGPSPDDLAPLATAPKDGFETSVVVAPVAHVVVEALDSSGTVLAASAPTPVS